MKSKIAGFILAPQPSDYTPAVNPSLIKTVLTGPWGYLTLYSTGEDIRPVARGVWSMGFPAGDSLMDHNLLISVTEYGVTVENDWLGSIPVYFNEKEKIVSTFPDVCLTKPPETDKEGLYLFFFFLFAALGTTPFKGIYTLRYYSALQYNKDTLSVTEKEDPLQEIDINTPTSENEIWDLLSNRIEDTLDQTSGPVINPLSGGYDSRIINALIPEKHQERNYTYSYGISPVQEKCFESQIARKVAHKLGVSWKQIHLSDAFQYTDLWHDLFGYGTHLHGMLHIEFFKKILNDLQPEAPGLMFTGISGSAFQGGHPPEKEATRPADIYHLALTHELNARSLLPDFETEAESKFFEQNRSLLKNPKWYPVMTMRIKMNLLHYLYKVPASMGIPSSSPYHDFEIARRMLSLPEKRRQNRTWVTDFFKKKDLHFGSRSLYGDTRNTLNRQLFRNAVYQPLTPEIWSNYGKDLINPEQIRQINQRLAATGARAESFRHFLTTQRVVKEILKKAGLTNTFTRDYSWWATLKAIEKSITTKNNRK